MLNQKKFVVTPKTESSVTVTVRIEKESHDRLEELVLKSGRSRNELINKAIKFALDNLEFDDGKRGIKLSLFSFVVVVIEQRCYTYFDQAEKQLFNILVVWCYTSKKSSAYNISSTSSGVKPLFSKQSISSLSYP